MQKSQKTGMQETYSQEVDEKNTLKMREILRDLPQFCRQFFRGISENTGTRTRLAYAYDLRVFFEFMHESNKELARMKIPDFPVSVLDLIQKVDIEEFLDWTSYYEKNGKVYTNDERGKSRKLSAIRSMYHYFYQSEQISRDVSALIPMPKLHEKPIIRLEPNEVAKLLDLAEDGAGLTKAEQRYHDKTAVRDTALLTLLLGTGIRVSECVGLDLNDVNFDENSACIEREATMPSSTSETRWSRRFAAIWTSGCKSSRRKGLRVHFFSLFRTAVSRSAPSKSWSRNTPLASQR